MRGWLCATQRVLRTAPSRLAHARALLLVSPTRIFRSRRFERFPRAFRVVYRPYRPPVLQLEQWQRKMLMDNGSDKFAGRELVQGHTDQVQRWWRWWL